MEYKELGKSGEMVSSIGMGTWKLGMNPEIEIRALGKGLDLGINLIDTAEMYGTEKLVGEAIYGRKDFFLATKVSPHHFRHDDLIAACESSLKKLNVKQIDLYQLHWPNASVPIDETMRAMEELVDRGKIKYIGVSNFSPKEFEEAQASMKRYEIISNQVEYSLMVRNAERELIGFAERDGIAIIAYSPLGRGALFDSRHEELRSMLEDIGKNYEKEASQVALNWLISRKNIVAIPKASTPKHVEENAGSVGWSLSKKDKERLSSFLLVGT